LRSGKEIRRLLDRHILPVWRDREFTPSSGPTLPRCSTRSRTTTAPARPITA
jgi:hypothetical protein